MKKLLYAFSLLFLVSLLYSSSTYASSFKDVNTQTESGAAIKQLAQRNIIQGYADNTFRPNGELTRQQAAKMVAKMLGIKSNNYMEIEFKDVPSSLANYDAIIAVAELGIMTGYEDETFRPEQKLTRAQATKIISEAFRLTSKKVSLPYKDVKNAETKFYVSNLYNNGVTNIPGSKFQPNKRITRAQFALFLTRAEKATTAYTKYATDFEYSAFSYTEYDENIVNVELDMYRLTLHPLKEGTARIVLYSVNEFDEFDRHFYLVHVTKQNGKFVISLEEESIYEHISYATSVYHYENGLYLTFVPTSFEIYDELGKIIPEDYYDIQINGEEVEVTMFMDGEFQLYFSNESNRSTHALLSYIENFLLDFSIETISPFIQLTSEDFGFTIEKASIVDYLNYGDEETCPFTLSFEDGVVLVKPDHIGEGVVRLIDSKGVKHYLDIIVHEKAGILIVDATWDE